MGLSILTKRTGEKQYFSGRERVSKEQFNKEKSKIDERKKRSAQRKGISSKTSDIKLTQQTTVNELSKFGTKDAPGTSIRNLRSGRKEFVDSRGRVIARFDPVRGSRIVTQRSGKKVFRKVITSNEGTKVIDVPFDARERLLTSGDVTFIPKQQTQTQQKGRATIITGTDGSRISSGTLLESLTRKEVKTKIPEKGEIKKFEQRVPIKGTILLTPTKRRKLELENEAKAIKQITNISKKIDGWNKNYNTLADKLFSGVGKALLIKETKNRTEGQKKAGRIIKKTIVKITKFLNPLIVGTEIGGLIKQISIAQKSGLINIQRLTLKGFQGLGQAESRLINDIIKGDKNALTQRLITTKKVLSKGVEVARTEEGLSTLLSFVIVTGILTKTVKAGIKGITIGVKGAKITAKVSPKILKVLTPSRMFASKRGRLIPRKLTNKEVKAIIKLLRAKGKLKPTTLKEIFEKGILKANAKIIIKPGKISPIAKIKPFKTIIVNGKKVKLVKKDGIIFKEVKKSIGSGRQKHKILVLQKLKPLELKLLTKTKVKPKIKQKQLQKQVQLQKQHQVLILKQKQILKSVGKTKNIQKLKKELILLSKQRLKFKQIQKQVQVISKFKPQVIKPKFKQELRLLSLQKLKLKQKQIQIQKQITIQILKQKTIQKLKLAKSKPIKKAKKITKKRLPIPLFTKKSKKLSRGERFAFNIRIKRAGKIKVLNVRLPKKRAIKRLMTVLDNSIARSGEIFIVGKTKQKDISSVSLKGFRLKRSRDPKVLRIVETSKKALDTKRERLQLVRSRRRKK